MSENNQNEGILVPGESAEVEARARASGWVSKDEFDSNPNNSGKKWRPADEFIERGELFDTIKSLKSEIHSVKKDFQVLAQHHRDVAKTEYERALKDLRAQRNIAAEEGDTKTVVEISDRIDELRESQRTQVSDNKNVQGTHPAFTSWVNDNSWYATDPALRGAADGVAQAYINSNPGAPFENVLEHVTKTIKKEFPNKFQSSQSRAPAVESGNVSSNAGGKKSKISKADLSDEERDVMRTLVRRGVLTEQEYLDDLAKVKGL